jgi:stearoyl-CoA desaturase (delta-9 desaturase)
MQLALLDPPWWGYVLVTLGLTHVTIAAVTILLHRHHARRALALHPAASHFFRFWLWLTSGMVSSIYSMRRDLNALWSCGADPPPRRNNL